VLLSLRNKLAVALYPSHLAVSRQSRGWRPTAGEPELVKVDSATEAEGWRCVVDALQIWLEQNKPASSTVECILSDCFVRYLLVPWSDQLQDPAEINALAGIQFESLYGEPSAQWVIKTGVSGYGNAAVACAVSRDLMTALEAMAAAHRLRITSIQPRWIRIFHRLRNRIANDALLMSLEAGQCILATVKNGAWHSIRTLKLHADVPHPTLDAVIDRELLLQGMDSDTTVYLHASDDLSVPPLRPRQSIMQFQCDALAASSQLADRLISRDGTACVD